MEIGVEGQESGKLRYNQVFGIIISDRRIELMGGESAECISPIPMVVSESGSSTFSVNIGPFHLEYAFTIR